MRLNGGIENFEPKLVEILPPMSKIEYENIETNYMKKFLKEGHPIQNTGSIMEIKNEN